MSELPDKPAITMTVSMALSSARKEMGLSQKDVADALFLNLSFIKLIDDNEIDAIPKKAFIKGYLRSYAKLVNLDPDAVVSLYGPGLLKDEPIVLKKMLRPDAVSKISFTGPVLISSIVGIVCLVLVIVLVWYFASSGDEKPIVVTSSSQSLQDESLQDDSLQDKSLQDSAWQDSALQENLGQSTSVENSLVQDNSLQERTIEDAGNTESEEAVSAFQENASASPTELDQIDLLADAAFDESNADALSIDDSGVEILFQRTSSGLNSFVTVDAGGSDDLNFVFTDDCWLEVEDGTGRSIYGDLSRAGDDLTITGEPPFKLLVGKPDVVSVKYNGEDIDLKPFITPARTAKLVLGNS
ncbi:MAG: cytoskeleton protein RodZ [Flavobacterium sp.]|jgi:cytoskeleton protein RodZ